MTEEEKKKKIFAMQSPSTQAAMLRHEKDPLGRRDQFDDWPPKGWKAVPDAKTLDELVAVRPLSYAEVVTELKLKQARGQYLAEIRGEQPVSSVDEAKRNRAIAAYMFVKKTFKEIMEMAGLAPAKKEEERELVMVGPPEKKEKLKEMKT